MENKMSEPMSIKGAIKKWEENHPGEDIGQAKVVRLHFMFPPIEKMDNSLSALTNCELLDLSTNMIEKIAGLGGLKRLRILSLSRNCIKNIAGLEPIAETLEELWISYNLFERIKCIGVCKKLKVLYMNDNLVKDWVEFDKLQELPMLEELKFAGNPLQNMTEETLWRIEVTRRLPNLKKFDGEFVVREATKGDCVN